MHKRACIDCGRMGMHSLVNAAGFPVCARCNAKTPPNFRAADQEEAKKVFQTLMGEPLHETKLVPHPRSRRSPLAERMCPTDAPSS
jgi:hypothetical protein